MSGCGETSDLYRKQREEARNNLAKEAIRRTHKISERNIWGSRSKKPHVRRELIQSETQKEQENQKPDPSVFY